MYLTQGLHRALQCHPGKIALRHLHDGGERATDFERLALQLASQAAALRARGAQAGDRRQHAGYKCPRSTLFSEVLPLSAAGKVLKTELRAMQRLRSAA